MSTTYELAGCPVCGSRGTELLADEDGILDEIDALWAHHTSGGDVVIPIPHLADRLVFTQPPPLAVVRCIACGLLYRNPRERFVRELYERESWDQERFEALLSAQRAAFAPMVDRITALNGGPGTGLEVGSYVGAFLDAAAAAGWTFTGVDVNAAAVAFLRTRGHHVLACDAEGAPRLVGGYDVVAILNCFDQLPDPRRAARAAHQRLRPGGTLALRVPNGDFYVSLRRHLHGALRQPATALLARHNFLGFPYRHGFTPAALRQLLAEVGFNVLEMKGAGVLPTADAVPGAERLLDAAELALRPLVGAPWLEVYAARE